MRVRFDQIILGRKRKEGWRRVNSINFIRNCHTLENPAMRLEGKKGAIEGGMRGGECGKAKCKQIQMNSIKLH